MALAGAFPQREQKSYHQLGGQTTGAQGSASAALALPRRSWRGWDRVTTAVEWELWALVSAGTRDRKEVSCTEYLYRVLRHGGKRLLDMIGHIR
jgi:hypothetical protein